MLLFEQVNFQLHHIGLYHPYHGGSNPNFDVWSSKILALKKNNPEAVKFFTNELVNYCSSKLPNDFSVITYVPSHQAYKTELTGIGSVATNVAQICNLNFVYCLERFMTIQKLSSGGCRRIDNHLNSIEVVDSHLINGKKVLLLDDVTTTGNSLQACQMLLEKAGAVEVYCLALAKTQS